MTTGITYDAKKGGDNKISYLQAVRNTLLTVYASLFTVRA